MLMKRRGQAWLVAPHLYHHLLYLLPQNTPSVPSGVKSWAQTSATHGAHGDGESGAVWGSQSGHRGRQEPCTVPFLKCPQSSLAEFWGPYLASRGHMSRFVRFV